MSYTFQYAEVLELKKACAEHFPDHVHFHDGCGGQYFSLDEENDALCGFIAGYFAERGLTAEFTGGGTVFTVSKNDTEAPECGGGFSMEILPKVL